MKNKQVFCWEKLRSFNKLTNASEGGRERMVGKRCSCVVKRAGAREEGWTIVCFLISLTLNKLTHQFAYRILGRYRRTSMISAMSTLLSYICIVELMENMAHGINRLGPKEVCVPRRLSREQQTVLHQGCTKQNDHKPQVPHWKYTSSAEHRVCADICTSKNEFKKMQYYNP